MRNVTDLWEVVLADQVAGLTADSVLEWYSSPVFLPVGWTPPDSPADIEVGAIPAATFPTGLEAFLSSADRSSTATPVTLSLSSIPVAEQSFWLYVYDTSSLSLSERRSRRSAARLALLAAKVDGMTPVAYLTGGAGLGVPLFSFPDGNSSSAQVISRITAGNVASVALQVVDPTFTEMTYAELWVESLDGTKKLILELDAPGAPDSFWSTYSTYGAIGTGLSVAEFGDPLEARGITVAESGLYIVGFNFVRTV